MCRQIKTSCVDVLTEQRDIVISEPKIREVANRRARGRMEPLPLPSDPASSATEGLIFDSFDTSDRWPHRAAKTHSNARNSSRNLRDGFHDFEGDEVNAFCTSWRPIIQEASSRRRGLGLARPNLQSASARRGLAESWHGLHMQEPNPDIGPGVGAAFGGVQSKIPIDMYPDAVPKGTQVWFLEWKCPAKLQLAKKSCFSCEDLLLLCRVNFVNATHSLLQTSEIWSRIEDCRLISVAFGTRLEQMDSCDSSVTWKADFRDCMQCSCQHSVWIRTDNTASPDLLYPDNRYNNGRYSPGSIC
jgi:hypothetical protein